MNQFVNNLDSRQPRSRASKLAKWLLVAVSFGGLMRIGCLQGLIVPVHIAGGSMAETLVGDHYQVECQDCCFRFRCDVAGLTVDQSVVCPNCGYPKNQLASAMVRSGQRVLIDRWPYWVGKPQRWDVVALQTPGSTEQLSVKRIVGLPGERVTIRNGDVWVDNQIAGRSLEIQRAMRVLVHDENFAPQKTPSLPSRWPLDRNSNEQRYHHWRGFASPFPRTDCTPVLDNDSYSPHESRTLHAVLDLTLTFRAQLSETGKIFLRAENGQAVFLIELHSRVVRFRREEAEDWEPAVKIKKNTASQSLAVEVSFCDHEFFVIVDDRELFRCTQQSTRADTLAPPPLQPFAMRVTGEKTNVSQRRIWRDIYYLPPVGLTAGWSLASELGPDEYLVLGDNSSISEDSRSAAFGPINKQAIVGPVRVLP